MMRLWDICSLSLNTKGGAVMGYYAYLLLDEALCRDMWGLLVVTMCIMGYLQLTLLLDVHYGIFVTCCLLDVHYAHICYLLLDVPIMGYLPICC